MGLSIHNREIEMILHDIDGTQRTSVRVKEVLAKGAIREPTRVMVKDEPSPMTSSSVPS